MKAVKTRVASYATGGAIADAVADYALALVREECIDTVEFPFVNDDGAVRRVRLIIGWRMEVDVVTRDGGPAEPTDAALIEELQMRALVLPSCGDDPIAGVHLGENSLIDEW